MQISTYTDLSDKEQYFKIIKIDTIKEFEIFSKEHKSEPLGIYRGINNAK